MTRAEADELTRRPRGVFVGNVDLPLTDAGLAYVNRTGQLPGNYCGKDPMGIIDSLSADGQIKWTDDDLPTLRVLKGDGQPVHPLDQMMAGFMTGLDKATAAQTPMLIEVWLHAAVHAAKLLDPELALRLTSRAKTLLDRLEAAEAKGEGENT